MNVKGKKRKNQVAAANIFEQQEMIEKTEAIKCSLKASTWRELETNELIPGAGENTLSGILAEMGDISRFDDVKEIQKISGLGLVACSSGKHKGETGISHRGRKRLRYRLLGSKAGSVTCR